MLRSEEDHNYGLSASAGSYALSLDKGVATVYHTDPENDSLRIVDVKTVKSPDPNLTKEAERVVKMMPKWKPGMHKGNAVRVKFTLPISFKLNGQEKPKEDGEASPITVVGGR